MSVHRAVLFVLAALFTAGMTSAASAGCGGCGTQFVYAQRVIPAPPRPVFVHRWWRPTCGCACSCRGLFGYTAGAELTPIAPAPIYVVNQGPDYTGPGIMVPYRTWTRPYLSGYRYGYGRLHYRHYGYGRFHYRHYGHRFGVHRAHIVYHARLHRRVFVHRPMPVARPVMHTH
ncbi:MAG: hypothetical protein WBF58_02455 [Xanthobacteraceae bacterium]